MGPRRMEQAKSAGLCLDTYPGSVDALGRLARALRRAVGIKGRSSFGK